MPTVYPTTPVWNAPVVRTLEFDTLIGKGQNSTEQRSMRHTGRESWTLSYAHISITERDTLLSTFETLKGSFDQTLSFTIDSVTYTGCFIDQDAMSFTENTNGVWSGTVTIARVIRPADTGSFPSDFPLLSTGAAMQLPYSHTRNFDTVAVRTEGGRYSYAKRNASLRAWSVGGGFLVDSEAQAIFDMFRLAGGRFREFAFTDPDSGARVTTCRFGADKLEWRNLGAGQNVVMTTIEELVA